MLLGKLFHWVALECNSREIISYIIISLPFSHKLNLLFIEMFLITSNEESVILSFWPGFSGRSLSHRDMPSLWLSYKDFLSSFPFLYLGFPIFIALADCFFFHITFEIARDERKFYVKIFFFNINKLSNSLPTWLFQINASSFTGHVASEHCSPLLPIPCISQKDVFFCYFSQVLFFHQLA